MSNLRSLRVSSLRAADSNDRWKPRTPKMARQRPDRPYCLRGVHPEPTSSPRVSFGNASMSGLRCCNWIPNHFAAESARRTDHSRAGPPDPPLTLVPWFAENACFPRLQGAESHRPGQRWIMDQPAAEAAPRLLIVEDDPMQLQITLEMARRFAQFSAIATAFGVSEALLIVKSGKIDIVLCDLSLAGQTCDEIVGAIRSLSLPRQPVIGMFTNEA
jgi:CheY-like chemotaxis protein